jgi:hypothetical protein
VLKERRVTFETHPLRSELELSERGVDSTNGSHVGVQSRRIWMNPMASLIVMIRQRALPSLDDGGRSLVSK